MNMLNLSLTPYTEGEGQPMELMVVLDDHSLLNKSVTQVVQSLTARSTLVIFGTPQSAPGKGQSMAQGLQARDIELNL